MKQITIFILIMLVSILQAFSQPILNEHDFVPNTLIVSIRAEAIGTTRGEINVSRTRNNQISIGLESFDRIAVEYNFTNIERMFTVVDHEFRSGSGTHIMNIFRITVDDNDDINDALFALSNDPDVIWVEFEGIATFDSVPTDEVNEQWSNFREIIQLPDMWNALTGFTGREIIVAIVDDGIKWNHDYLMNSIFVDVQMGMEIDFNTGVISPETTHIGSIDPWDWNAIFPGDVIGWNFFRDPNTNDVPTSNQSFQSFAERYPVCPIIVNTTTGEKQHKDGNCVHRNDHGTHVAGIVRGVIGHSSMAPNIKLLPTRHTTTEYLDNFQYNGYSGIMYAADKGARVINCSWGAYGNENLAEETVNYAFNKGSLVIATAGNNAVDTKRYPAAATDAIAVAASHGNNGAWFTNFGNWINIIAPGQNIVSTSFDEHGNDITRQESGTSMAAPMVSAVAAIMMSLDPLMTPQQVRNELTSIRNTDRFGEFSNPLVPNSNIPNAGRLNAYKAIQSVLPRVIEDDYTFPGGGTIELPGIIVTNGAKVTISGKV